MNKEGVAEISKLFGSMRALAEKLDKYEKKGNEEKTSEIKKEILDIHRKIEEILQNG